MTDADRLWAAAKRIRELAEAATPGPWDPTVLGSEGYEIRADRPTDYAGHRLSRVRVARCGMEAWDVDKSNAPHIAAWHPEAALAIADWLERTALYAENGEIDKTGRLGALKHDALAFADAFTAGLLP